jgi:hypothetical protein
VGEEVNVELVDVTKPQARPFAGQLRRYAFKATRYIPPGEEVLTNYGPTYGVRGWQHNGERLCVPVMVSVT